MNPWVAIVGRTRHGKGEATQRLLARWRAAGLRVGGFIQHASDDGFELLELLDGQRCPLAHRSAAPDICDFAFEAAGIARGRRWIREAAPRADVVFVEVGKLEARGEVHWQAALDALDGPPVVVVLRVRPDVLFAVADQLPDPADGLELPADNDEVERFAGAVVALAR